MSWLGIANFVLFQWFFIRLARVQNVHTGKTIKYVILKGIIPLTGWWSSFKRVEIKTPALMKIFKTK